MIVAANQQRRMLSDYHAFRVHKLTAIATVNPQGIAEARRREPDTMAGSRIKVLSDAFCPGQVQGHALTQIEAQPVADRRGNGSEQAISLLDGDSGLLLGEALPCMLDHNLHVTRSNMLQQGLCRSGKV
ncbi:hypothetical protein C6A77_13850 [Pseudomonas sp. AFG_SD02_1510_Pfu_092]|nr:hypothetical protein C6A77_13850 [Pseudomonas sp. AFG_SD02_1510_Pfu_092]